MADSTDLDIGRAAALLGKYAKQVHKVLKNLLTHTTISVKKITTSGQGGCLLDHISPPPGTGGRAVAHTCKISIL